MFAGGSIAMQCRSGSNPCAADQLGSVHLTMGACKHMLRVAQTSHAPRVSATVQYSGCDGRNDGWSSRYDDSGRDVPVCGLQWASSGQH